MIDTELQDRVNRALNYIIIAKRSWSYVEEDLNKLLDDEWDFEEYEQKAALDAAMEPLNALEKILNGKD